METLTIVLVTAAVLAAVCIWLLTKVVSAVWRSRLFWATLLFLSIVAVPVTAGWSVVALVALFVIRVYLVGKVLEPKSDHSK